MDRAPLIDFALPPDDDKAMMSWILTAFVTLPGAPLSIQVNANVGRSGGTGARTLECPSMCFTHLRHVEARETEVCYRKEMEEEHIRKNQEKKKEKKSTHRCL